MRTSKAYLLGDELVGLVEESAALRVAEDHPRKVDILELLEPVMGEEWQS